MMKHTVAGIIIGLTLLFSLKCSLVFGRLIGVPDNLVALVGETIQFNCSTDQIYSIHWQHVPFGSKSVEDVYISRTVVLPYHPRYSVRKHDVGNNVTEYNLLISSVKREDAGSYRCRDEAGQGQQHYAELTVLESLPNCETNIVSEGLIGENDCGIEPETIRCSCSLEYIGNISPDMHWATFKGKNIQYEVQTNNTTDNSVHSHLRVKATVIMNGTSIIWYPKQSMHNNWTSSKIKILSVKTNLSTVVVRVSESVTCSVSSSEHCKYRWIAKIRPNNDFETLEGQSLRVERPGNYRCEAICPLKHMPCIVTSLHVECSSGLTESEGECSMYIGILSTAGIIINIGLVLTIIFLCVRRRTEKSNEQKKYKQIINFFQESEHKIPSVQEDISMPMTYRKFGVLESKALTLPLAARPPIWSLV